MDQHQAEHAPAAGGASAGRAALVCRVIDAELMLRRRMLATRMSPLLDLNLTMQQTKVLLALSISDCLAEGGLSGQDLSRNLGVGLATVSGIVDRLVGQGLVVRAEDPDDRRIRRVELTADGRDLVDRLRDAGIEHLRQLLDRLDDESLADLERVITKLAAAATTPSPRQPCRPQ
jgi:DNA-binding MarR family transcriptional regulator